MIPEGSFVEPDLSALADAPEHFHRTFKYRIDEARKENWNPGEFHWRRAGDTYCACHGAHQSDDVYAVDTWTMTGRNPIFRKYPGSDAEMFIQWKGTSVCMDVYCDACGAHSHIDSDITEGPGCYWIRCPECRATYQLGSQVLMIRRDLPDDQKAVEGTP